MAELFTEAEVEKFMREEVADAGGAKTWLRKNKVYGCDHVLHMVTNGSAATLDRILPVLGFKRVIRYEAVTPATGSASTAADRGQTEPPLSAHTPAKDPS